MNKNFDKEFASRSSISSFTVSLSEAAGAGDEVLHRTASSSSGVECGSGVEAAGAGDEVLHKTAGGGGVGSVVSCDGGGGGSTKRGSATKRQRDIPVLPLCGGGGERADAVDSTLAPAL